MLPQKLLQYSFDPRPGATRLVPHFFTERDEPWIRKFHDEFLRLKGRSRREVIAHFASPLSFDFPKRKGNLLFHLLHRLSADVVGNEQGGAKRDHLAAANRGPKPGEIREALFVASARSMTKPDMAETIQRVSAERGIEAGSVLEKAFSDLPLERKLISMPEGLAPEALRLRANLLLAQGLVCRASKVVIAVEGGSRRLVRQIKLRRLICEVPSESRLDVSGPLSLFGHTLLYGRALAELVPMLFWSHRFEFNAFCRIGGRDAILQIDSNTALLPSREPSEHDSKVEARFAKDFGRLAPDWDLVRESEPVSAGDSLIFPDFKIVHRRDRRTRILLEIIGYWTPEYLSRKLKKLTEAGLTNLILCVDESLRCSPQRGALDAIGPVLVYKRRIQVPELLALMDRLEMEKKLKPSPRRPEAT